MWSSARCMKCQARSSLFFADPEAPWKRYEFDKSLMGMRTALWQQNHICKPENIEKVKKFRKEGYGPFSEEFQNYLKELEEQ